MELLEIAARLSAAAVVSAAVGLNRELHDKPAGLRTHALVGLGSALSVLSVGGGEQLDAVSRVAQGVLTGIGFLGGGVILRQRDKGRVHGLTTAATIWVTALFGVACGAGRYREVSVAAVLLFLVLTFGGPIERLLHRTEDRGHSDGEASR